ncbi:XRE family transcriptional regulator [Psychromonas sp. RZ22]|uniref:helix-turn-helix domain-containing protein n=1 Tax=Psychromonas algarum TaxID=2555643 RepID=UPI0010685F0C|nr:XRE family transcriptional regulator [Psychromonas sp. RZ22]TEW53958.1 XRE family transcriptional regulator [Psychromonas sp. RZ22]
MTNLINTTVATQLKKARSEKGWSLDLASQHCGVSKAMLGQIERGESSPTIAKLWKIATGFSLPLSDFLGYENKQNLNAKGFDENQSICIETVFEFDKNTAMEVFDLCLAVGHEQYSEAHQTGVIEHIVVLSGSMQYLLGSEWKTLQVGDKAKFVADQAHAYRNIGDVPLRFFNIIYYPK